MVGHLVAGPDKFKGTATAAEVAEAAVRGARAAGWTAEAVPLSDGGEGLLDAVGGEVRRTRVPGPDGRPVDAEWRLVDQPGAPLTAVLESAQAAGLALVGGPTGNDPWSASTAGVGRLVLAAVAAGARRVVVGLGGSATTDGGHGAVEVIGSPDALAGVELVVACDVTTEFLDAPARFGPQKGADRAMVDRLTRRLEGLADRYRDDFGVDVTRLSGTGAAGGLAGGLAALGGRLVSGFELVSAMVGLPDRLAGADAVMTGEGQLDATSFDGKVVGGVLGLVAGRVPVLCVVGRVGDGNRWATPPGLAELVDLSARVGPERAHREVQRLVEQAVVDYLGALG